MESRICALYLKTNNVLFVFEEKTEHEWGRGRDGDTESEAGSRL